MNKKTRQFTDEQTKRQVGFYLPARAALVSPKSQKSSLPGLIFL
jgi:hypothetical protein